jgi:hypothetical protein
MEEILYILSVSYITNGTKFIVTVCVLLEKYTLNHHVILSFTLLPVSLFLQI